MSIQIIERDGAPEWAVVPYETYLHLVEQAEMLQDVHDFDSVKAAMEHGEEELVPAEVAFALLDGANSIRVWREYRRMTQNELADKAGISIPYLSQLETGKRTGSVEVLSALARSLNVDLDDLVEMK